LPISTFVAGAACDVLTVGHTFVALAGSPSFGIPSRLTVNRL